MSSLPSPLKLILKYHVKVVKITDILEELVATSFTVNPEVPC
jgi:hypothetical protein